MNPLPVVSSGTKTRVLSPEGHLPTESRLCRFSTANIRVINRRERPIIGRHYLPLPLLEE